MNATYRLYGYFRSSAAYRVRIALNLKGLAAEAVSVNLRTGDQNGAGFRAINPQKLVPVLETPNHGLLFQSLAIVEYLDDIAPTPPFLPATPADRAFARALAQMIACDIHPINNLRVLNQLRALGHDDKAVVAWYHHWLQEGFEPIEQLLKDRNAGDFCMGPVPGLVDICLVPQVYNAERYAYDLTPYPTIRRIVATCRAHLAFAAAAPEKQHDAT